MSLALELGKLVRGENRRISLALYQSLHIKDWFHLLSVVTLDMNFIQMNRDIIIITHAMKTNSEIEPLGESSKRPTEYILTLIVRRDSNQNQKCGNEIRHVCM